MKKRVKRMYGWVPDVPDHRDHMFMVMAPEVRGVMPQSVDLRAGMPPVYDQGRTGSCVGQSTTAAHWYAHWKAGVLPPVQVSRLFVYYEARRIEGRAMWDCGCMIRDAMKVMVGEGACPESEWPFVQSRVTLRPGRGCYKSAGSEQVIEYLRLQEGYIVGMKQCLADGYPFVVGISLYESFESAQVAKSGIVPMPGKGESMVGGHAVLVVGFNDNHGGFLVRNSWSTAWGQDGYFWLPYEYLANANLATDLWTVRRVE